MVLGRGPFKSTSGERATRTHESQMLPADLGCCHRATRLGLGTELGGTAVPWQKSLLRPTSGSHVLFFCFTSLVGLLCVLGPLLL